jgi:hypothetical protein
MSVNIVTEPLQGISQESISSSEKILKTDTCTLNAIKRYKLKNSVKIKEYHKQYNKQVKEAKIAENPNLTLTKKELIEKITILENKIKEYELKLNKNTE